jgi:Zn-finger protein
LLSPIFLKDKELSEEIITWLYHVSYLDKLIRWEISAKTLNVVEDDIVDCYSRFCVLYPDHNLQYNMHNVTLSAQLIRSFGVLRCYWVMPNENCIAMVNSIKTANRDEARTAMKNYWQAASLRVPVKYGASVFNPEGQHWPRWQPGQFIVINDRLSKLVTESSGIWTCEIYECLTRLPITELMVVKSIGKQEQVLFKLADVTIDIEDKDDITYLIPYLLKKYKYIYIRLSDEAKGREARK